MSVMAPKNKWELADMLKYAIAYEEGPIALRYPRGTAYDGLEEFRAPIEHGKSEMLYKEDSIALVAVGSMVQTAMEVRELLKQEGWNCTVVNARFVKPLDEEMLQQLAEQHKLVVTMEENILSGGFGERVLDYYNHIQSDLRVMNIALPDDYIEHGSVDLLKEETGVDAQSVYDKIKTQYMNMYR
jgi:1-deoxy-D-xylulose-5-phosphate synthase